MGTLERNEDRLLRDKSSAKWLALVSMYVGYRKYLWDASTNTKHLRRCIISLSLLVLERKHATTTWLSHWQRTCRPCHEWPQAAQARIIGISSFTAMERGADRESH